MQLHAFSIQVKTQLEAQTSMISISKEVEAIKAKEIASPASEAATMASSSEANATKTSEEICALVEDCKDKNATNQKEDK